MIKDTEMLSYYNGTFFPQKTDILMGETHAKINEEWTLTE